MSLAELRARTGPLHQRLDNRLQLFSKVRTRAEYRDHILRFYRLLNVVEQQLKEFPEWERLGVNWGERAKCNLLRADLTALGANEEAISHPAPPAALPPLGTFAESVGSLYVLEGSTLGAQYISRHYEECLGLTAATGMAFHTGYGAATGHRWKEFCAALEKFFAENPQQKEEALDAACAAFTAVEETLCATEQETIRQ